MLTVTLRVLPQHYCFYGHPRRQRAKGRHVNSQLSRGRNTSGWTVSVTGTPTATHVPTSSRHSISARFSTPWKMLLAFPCWCLSQPRTPAPRTLPPSTPPSPCRWKARSSSWQPTCGPPSLTPPPPSPSTRTATPETTPQWNGCCAVCVSWADTSRSR